MYLYIDSLASEKLSAIRVHDTCTKVRATGGSIERFSSLLSQNWLLFTNDKIPCEASTMITEPAHEISNSVVCATGKGSEQFARMRRNTRRLIRALAGRLNII